MNLDIATLDFACNIDDSILKIRPAGGIELSLIDDLDGEFACRAQVRAQMSFIPDMIEKAFFHLEITLQKAHPFSG